MRALTILAVAGVSLSVHSIALGADVPLSVLNGGPSSDSIPTANQDPVALIVSPREIVNAGIPTNLPIGDLNGNSLLVQDASDPTGSGVRNRSRAVMAVFDVNNANPPLLQVQANLGFDPTVDDSYFVFLSADDAATIDTMGELDAFIASVGADYVKILLDQTGFTAGSGVGGEFTDSDLSDVNLNAGGLVFRASDLLTIDPGASGPSGGSAGAALNFEVGIVVLSDGAGPNPDVPTEYFCVRTDPERVVPIEARLPGENQRFVIEASMPLITDGGEMVSLSDTNPAALTGTAFRMRLSGTGPIETLESFLLNRLSTPRTISSVEVTGEKQDRLILTLDAPLASPDDVDIVLDSTIGFSPSFTTNSIYSFAGENTNSSAATFVAINRPAACPGNGIDADVNDDKVIDFADLNAVLSSFGQAGSHPGDVNNDDVVDFADLNAVLSAFGMSCE